MTTSISILGCVLLSLAAAVSLKPSHCGVDLRLTPSDDVLAGTNTPVYFFRSDKNSPLGHRLIPQQDAIANLISQSPFFKESGTRRIDNNDECSQFLEWVWGLNYSLEFVALSTIYPKVVVIVENGVYQGYEKESNKLTKLLEYVLAYWNGVDQFFRTLENPKVRFNIAGIIVEEHAGDLPFLSMGSDGRLIVEPHGYSVKRFFQSNASSWSDHFGHYDIAVVMPSLTDGGVVYRDDKNTPGSPQIILSGTGFGYWGTRQVSQDVAWSFGIDSKLCPRNESVVTSSYFSMAQDLPDWSDCYLNAFKKRFNTREAARFFKKPNIRSPLSRVMYGQTMDCDGQCGIIRGSKCHMNESICQNLICFPQSGGITEPLYYAADGTACGDEKICFRRKCVLKKEVDGSAEDN